MVVPVTSARLQRVAKRLLSAAREQAQCRIFLKVGGARPSADRLLATHSRRSVLPKGIAHGSKLPLTRSPDRAKVPDGLHHRSLRPFL